MENVPLLVLNQPSLYLDSALLYSLTSRSKSLLKTIIRSNSSSPVLYPNPSVTYSLTLDADFVSQFSLSCTGPQDEYHPVLFGFDP